MKPASHARHLPNGAFRGPVVYARGPAAPDEAAIVFTREAEVGNPRVRDVWTHTLGGDAPARRISAGSPDASPFDLSPSPDGALVASYATAITPRKLSLGVRTVGMARVAGQPGALDEAFAKRRRASAFAWAGSSGDVVFYDGVSGSLELVDGRSGASARLVEVADASNVLAPPALAVDESGSRVALVTRDAASDKTEVRIVERSGQKASETRLLTSVNGVEARVSPMWSKDGRDLALHIVHPAHKRSIIVAHYDLRGGGEMLHAREMLDGTEPPAWSASGKTIAFFAAALGGDTPERSGPPALTLLDIETRTLHVVSAPTERGGRCRFVNEDTLVVDGHDAAHVLRFDRVL